MRSLMPHQQSAFDWAKNRNHAALFLGMRLGKTLTAIRLAKNGTHRLVVCPLSVCRTWGDELNQENEQYHILTGSLKKRLNDLMNSPQDCWIITNYEGLITRNQRTPSGKPKAVPSAIATFHWDWVIVDESTRIRCPKSQITKVMCQVFKDTPHKIILSGIPTPENDTDIVTQMIFTYGEFMGCKSYWEWRHRYMINFGFNWAIKARYIKDVEKAVQALSFAVTRKEVGLGGEKVYQTRYIPVPPSVMKQHQMVKTDLMTENRMTKSVLVGLLWMQQLATGIYEGHTHNAKINELNELVTGELAKEPLLVWCRYSAEIAQIKEHLKVPYTYIDGACSLSERWAAINQLKTGQVSVLILQARCAQFGLDLSHARTAIYYGHYWDGEIRAQSEERMVHPLKKDPLLFIDLVGKDTIEEQIVKVSRQKNVTSESFLSELTKATFGVSN